MKPHDFITKWRGVEQKERSASQSHFNDLCALLDVPDPISVDPKGEWFAFEKGASKTAGGEGSRVCWSRPPKKPQNGCYGAKSLPPSKGGRMKRGSSTGAS